MTSSTAFTQGFWATLPRPIIGLSPMDGVTNAPFRLITARVGRPDVMFTEFVPVEGLMHKAIRLLRDFDYDEIERPIVAQIYGNTPSDCYAIAHLMCEMGFDGIDINMGCPAKKVAQRGAGAGLIRTPDVAKAMIRAVQRGVHDWCDGQSPLAAGVPAAVVTASRVARRATRDVIPVSVKTRIGYDAIVIEDWVQHLLECEPAVISIHGRTLKQMYRGAADWDAIARAAEIIHRTKTLVLGNGDLETPEQITARICETGVDGVLIGRAVIGNPWIFQETRDARRETRDVLHTLIAHAHAMEQWNDGAAFTHFFRLVKPYTSGLANAAALRTALYAAKTAAQVEAAVGEYYSTRDEGRPLPLVAGTRDETATTVTVVASFVPVSGSERSSLVLRPFVPRITSKHLILASTSPRRHELLQQLARPFTMVAPHIDETIIAGEAAHAMVARLAIAKARVVAEKNPHAVVIGSDTTVVLDEMIFGKPTSPDDATQMLTQLSGHTHQVCTAVAVCCLTTNFSEVVVDVAHVTMIALTAEEITAYVATGEPLDKAGAYAAQGLGARLIEKISGDFQTVVGLPLVIVRTLLGRADV